jgi:hypothetical protein
MILATKASIKVQYMSQQYQNLDALLLNSKVLFWDQFYSCSIQPIYRPSLNSINLHRTSTQTTFKFTVCRPADAYSLTAHMARYVDDVNNWMRANRLQLNAGKTDLLWCSLASGIHKLPTASMSLGGHTVAVTTADGHTP